MASPTSTGVSSGIERRVVVDHLTALLSTMRELRDLPAFWHGLGPGIRQRWEDFQADVASMRIEWKE
jgi:hypothetical protein